MKVFCDTCHIMNYQESTDKPTIFEAGTVKTQKTVTSFIDGVKTIEDIECYVCPEGHYVCKDWADLVDAERMKSCAEFGSTCADLVDATINLLR